MIICNVLSSRNIFGSSALLLVASTLATPQELKGQTTTPAGCASYTISRIGGSIGVIEVNNQCTYDVYVSIKESSSIFPKGMESKRMIRAGQRQRFNSANIGSVVINGPYAWNSINVDRSNSDNSRKAPSSFSPPTRSTQSIQNSVSTKRQNTGKPVLADGTPCISGVKQPLKYVSNGIGIYKVNFQNVCNARIFVEWTWFYGTRPIREAAYLKPGGAASATCTTDVGCTGELTYTSRYE